MEIEDRKQLEQRIAELERQLKNERQKQQWALEGEDSGLGEYDIKANGKMRTWLWKITASR